MYNENIINTPDNCMSEIINEGSSVLKIAILAKKLDFNSCKKTRLLFTFCQISQITLKLLQCLQFKLLHFLINHYY